MKLEKNLIFLFCALVQFRTISQSIINGDFELHNLSKCELNQTDTDFNKKMPNVYAFGKTYIYLKYQGEVDIQKKGCYVSPYSGNWCIGLGSDYLTNKTSDAIALELTSALIQGNKYKLSFYILGNTTFSDSLGYLLVGESVTNSDFGKVIDSISPIAMTWKEINIEFIAQENSNFITIKNEVGINAWNQVDSFSISEITGTSEYEKGKIDFTIFPNPSEYNITIAFNDPIIFRFAKVYNIYGECILNSESCKIDLSNVSPGYYLIYVITEAGIASNKLIKK
ncbi:MAG: T9SS type A sorting domain-containing protein [Saprospiraceae bacterium]|nr:T9SS type A sorting domain-containing protein [Saprospiraceae bacterium]